MTPPRTSAFFREDALGRFEQVKRPPIPRLESVVHGYTGYSHRSARTLRRREPAQDRVTVILNFGAPMRVGGPTRAMSDVGSFVAPLSDTYAVTEEGNASAGMQVDLFPLGAYMLFGLPMEELSEVVVPLEDAIGAEAPLLVERLFLAPDWPTRFAMLDSFVAARIEDVRPSPDIVWAWRRLSETAGRLPIKALAAELGCSRRHLARRFREQIGPSPKAAARLLRFQNAARQLALDDGRRFAEIAQDCGYYDQAHLNRDFRELAGTTPRALLASHLPGPFGVAA